MSTPRTQLLRRFSAVGGRIIRGEKKVAPEEPAFSVHLNAATNLHRRKLRPSQTQIVRQPDGADASSPAATSNVLGVHAAEDIIKSDSLGVWSEAHRDSATARNRKRDDQRYEKMMPMASAVAPKSATEVFRTERAKNLGEFFVPKTIDDVEKVKPKTISENLSPDESATGSAKGLVPVVAIVSGSAFVLYNLEALQGML